jgi:protein TonB
MYGERHPFRIGVPAAASLAVNAVLVAAMLSLGMGRAGPSTNAPSLTVVSLSAVKGAAEGEEKVEPAEAAKPPEPVQSAPDAVARPAVAALSSVPPPLIAWRPAPAIAPAPAPRSAEPSTARAAAPAAQSVPAAIAVPAAAGPAPARRGTADGLAVKAPAGKSHAYAARVRSWLYAHMRYPRRAKMRHEEGVVRVRFVLDRAGGLLEGAIIHGSGNAPLDEEAMAMLRRASPFPGAPRDISGEQIEFTIPIAFELTA